MTTGSPISPIGSSNWYPASPPPNAIPKRCRGEPGDLVFNQGDRGDLVYVVEEGEIQIFRVRSDSSEEFLAVIGPGNYFGELGPMLNLPRSASARCRTAARLTGYPLRAFRRQFPVSQSGAHATAIESS